MSSFSGRVFIVLLMIAAFLAIWKAREILLVASLGVLLGVGLTPIIDRLERHRIRRGFGVVLALFAVAGLIWGLYLIIGPSIGRQVTEIREDLPEALHRTWTSVRAALPGEELPSREELKEAMRDQAAEDLGGVGEHLIGIFRGLAGAVAGFLLVIAVACYTAANPRLYSRSFLMLIGEDRRPRVSAGLDAVADTWRQWLFAQFISMLVIGALTTLALWLLDVRAPLALGLLAGISEFIPVFGPLLSAIPALAIAFVDSPGKALGVLVAYLVIQQIESNVVTPLIMKKAVHIPPVITILAGSLMVIFAGFAGLLMAVPLVAAFTAVGRVYFGDEFLA
ncbi:MAG: AI-2E family transporter [Acidobacteria bacterium]|nr:AI-2E family transporter [Acidobacteriota bacterium]